MIMASMKGHSVTVKATFLLFGIITRHLLWIFLLMSWTVDGDGYPIPIVDNDAQQHPARMTDKEDGGPHGMGIADEAPKAKQIRWRFEQPKLTSRETLSPARILFRNDDINTSCTVQFFPFNTTLELTSNIVSEYIMEELQQSQKNKSMTSMNDILGIVQTSLNHAGFCMLSDSYTGGRRATSVELLHPIPWPFDETGGTVSVNNNSTYHEDEDNDNDAVVIFEVEGVYQGCDRINDFEIWSNVTNITNSNSTETDTNSSDLSIDTEVVSQQQQQYDCSPIPLATFQQNLTHRLEAYVKSAICQERQTTFTNIFLLSANTSTSSNASIENIQRKVSQEQLQILATMVVDTFNDLAKSNNNITRVCDPFRRRLIDANITIREGRRLGNFNNGPPSPSRRLQDENGIDNSLLFPSMAPSIAPSSSSSSSPIPSSVLRSVTSSFQLVLTVIGTCQGCERGALLFDQTTDRNGNIGVNDGDDDIDTGSHNGRKLNEVRHRWLQNTTTPSPLSDDECSCPATAVQQSVRANVFFKNLNDRINEVVQDGASSFEIIDSINLVQSLEQVECVENNAEANNVDSQASTHLFLNGVDNLNLESLAETIQWTYNSMNRLESVQRDPNMNNDALFCDPLVREIVQVNSIFNDVSGPLNRAIFEVVFRCKSGQCTNGSNGLRPTLFDTSASVEKDEQDFRRALLSTSFHDVVGQQRELEMVFLDELCFCPVGVQVSGIPLPAFETKLVENLSSKSGVITPLLELTEVEAVDCGQNEEFIVFSQNVVVEVGLRPGSTNISPDEIDTIQSTIVSTYNQMMEESYCDPYFRLLNAATIEDQGTIFAGRFPLLLRVNATCQGCLVDDASIYGSSTDVRDTPERKGRRLQLESSLTQNGTSSTCYCNTESIAYDAPSEIEFIQALGTNLEAQNLPNVDSTGNCGATSSFQSTVRLSFVGRVPNLTEEDQSLLVNLFTTTYRKENAGEESCDPLFRRIENVNVVSSPSSTRTAIMEERGGPKRDLQEEEEEVVVEQNTPSENPTTFTPSVSPSSISPSSAPSEIFSTNFFILISISGTCVGCEADTNLFDIVDLRRALRRQEYRLRDPEISTVSPVISRRQIQEYLASPSSCFCPIEKPAMLLTEADFANAYQDSVETAKEEGLLAGVDAVKEVKELDDDDDLDDVEDTISTEVPSLEPTTSLPTQAPSSFPSQFPSSFPSSFPSTFPSEFPSMFPSMFPTITPSAVPSVEPSFEPSSVPTVVPSFEPTTKPSLEPSQEPTDFPSRVPSIAPTILPCTFEVTGSAVEPNPAYFNNQVPFPPGDYRLEYVTGCGTFDPTQPFHTFRNRTYFMLVGGPDPSFPMPGLDDPPQRFWDPDVCITANQDGAEPKEITLLTASPLGFVYKDTDNSNNVDTDPKIRYRLIRINTPSCDGV